MPGKPEESIIVYRLESTEPGVMMPELPRRLVAEEATALVREWIAQMKAPIKQASALKGDHWLRSVPLAAALGRQCECRLWFETVIRQFARQVAVRHNSTSRRHWRPKAPASGTDPPTSDG